MCQLKTICKSIHKKRPCFKFGTAFTNSESASASVGEYTYTNENDNNIRQRHLYELRLELKSQTQLEHGVRIQYSMVRSLTAGRTLNSVPYTDGHKLLGDKGINQVLETPLNCPYKT